MKQKTYIMIKPEFANYPSVIEEIKRRIRALGLNIIDESFVRYDVEHARQHYAEHVGEKFYPELENYIISGDGFGMIVEGEDAVAKFRAIAGSANEPQEGSIRYDIPRAMGIEPRMTENVVHSSGSEVEAINEIKIFLELKKLYKQNNKDGGATL